MSCGSVILVNENNWEIFSTEIKVVLKSFEKQGLIGPCAKV